MSGGSRTRATFSRASLKRGILAVEEAGHTVHTVEFPPGGGFTLILAAGTEQAEVNEWMSPWGSRTRKDAPCSGEDWGLHYLPAADVVRRSEFTFCSFAARWRL